MPMRAPAALELAARPHAAASLGPSPATTLFLCAVRRDVATVCESHSPWRSCVLAALQHCIRTCWGPSALMRWACCCVWLTVCRCRRDCHLHTRRFPTFVDTRVLQHVGQVRALIMRTLMCLYVCVG